MSLNQLLRNYTYMLLKELAEVEHTYPAKVGDIEYYKAELKRVEKAKEEAGDAQS